MRRVRVERVECVVERAVECVTVRFAGLDSVAWRAANATPELPSRMRHKIAKVLYRAEVRCISVFDVDLPCGVS
jgi:hypothetical protein